VTPRCARRAITPWSSSRQAFLEQAEQLLEDATELAAVQGSRLFGLRATVDLCRLRLDTGRRDAAHQPLTAALADFAEGGADADLLAARKLLGEIDASSE
jgi:hypothetical protein